ncbi:MAG: alpha/beta hydrolase [Gammaproteobacteria bacterium]|nr:alpha/beta hydrolase [Gammaproteobacteria bacterium]MDH4255475.1 alpha/beta hydrolase [Gammaproteobacteria bacterium]MDH5309510.1 alpha/beta hydrolase [Gammaproteobacteria bacterium]
MSASAAKLAIFILLCFLAMPMAVAATADTPVANAEIERYGDTFADSQIGGLRAIYKQHLREAGFPQPEVERDIAYGEHPQQRLDVHRTLEPTEDPAPVLVFVHGGAFVRGDKGDGEIFDNVLNYFSRHGIVGVNVNYRLAPEFQWPSGAEDLAAVLGWIRDNAGRINADPGRIFLLGHSAGAAHVAQYTFMETLQPAGGADGLAGSVLISGVYSGSGSDSMPAYYGDDESLWPARVPSAHVDGRAVPLFIVDAQYDRLAMQKEAVDLIQAVCERDNRCPRHKQVPGHNHYSIMYSFNTADDSIAGDVLQFIRDHGSDQARSQQP